MHDHTPLNSDTQPVGELTDEQTVAPPELQPGFLPPLSIDPKGFANCPLHTAQRQNYVQRLADTYGNRQVLRFLQSNLTPTPTKPGSIVMRDPHPTTHSNARPHVRPRPPAAQNPTQIPPNCRVEIPPFGTFLVVSDGPTPHDIPGLETITQAEFNRRSQIWNMVANGTGSLHILSYQIQGIATPIQYPDFASKVQEALAILMSRPHGLTLVTQLVTGSQQIFIRPRGRSGLGPADTRPLNPAASMPRLHGAHSEGTGAGSSSVIEVDANLEDDTVQAFGRPAAPDQSPPPLASPLFILLGHELIHALHNAHGTNRRDMLDLFHINQNSSREEGQTIEEGDGSPAGLNVTENQLRAEHPENHLGQRDGHNATDNYSPLFSPHARTNSQLTPQQQAEANAENGLIQAASPPRPQPPMPRPAATPPHPANSVDATASANSGRLDAGASLDASQGFNNQNDTTSISSTNEAAAPGPSFSDGGLDAGRR